MKGRISTMHCFRKVTNDLYWVGGSDRRLELFENLFPIPRGVSYNSYLLLDEKTVLFDTVDNSIGRQFLDNITALLNGRTLDYLVVNHMEPDHCSMIADLMLRYPDMQIIGNAKTFPMIRQFYALDPEGKTIAVKEGDTFSSGTHTFRFLMAPMVHWPEVMLTYDETDKVLFSADAFGTFGALNGATKWILTATGWMMPAVIIRISSANTACRCRTSSRKLPHWISGLSARSTDRSGETISLICWRNMTSGVLTVRKSKA